MSDQRPGPEEDPTTSIRPSQPPQPGQPGQPGQPSQPGPVQHTQPLGRQPWGPPSQGQAQPQGQGQAQGQWQAPQEHWQGSLPPGQQAQGQPGQQGQPWQQGAPPPVAPGGPGSRRAGRGDKPGGRGIGIGLLAAALVLGVIGGFGGAWLKESSGGGGGGDTVDANEINTAGLDLQDLVSVQTVAEKALPSVVKIEGTRADGSGSGSGVIISEDGMILTNYHVAWLGEDGGSLEVLFDDGSSAEAEIVGVDSSMDIAVIQAQDVSGLTAIAFGDGADVKVGQAVVAVGSPYGLESTVTAGIISTVNRPVSVPTMDGSSKPMVYPGLQTDAAINPGNSGGALVNIKGELVGMNSANKLAQSSEGDSGDLGSIGIGWAIPINVLEPIVAELKEGQDPTHAWLGIDPGDAKEKGLARGAEVAGFLDGGNAEDAGVEEGDIITAIDDYAISDGLGLVTTALQFRPGDEVTLHVVRDGEEQEIKVEMDERGDLFED